jgi:hypothetical protein
MRERALAKSHHEVAIDDDLRTQTLVFGALATNSQAAGSIFPSRELRLYSQPDEITRLIMEAAGQAT